MKFSTRIDLRAALIALALTTGIAACDKGTAEADKKAADAVKDAKEASDKANEARLKADAELAKARVAHGEVRAKLQKDLDAHERKATYLKEKVAKLTGVARKNADAAVAELDVRRETAKTSMAKLGDDASTTWDAMRKTAEDDAAAVGKSVDSLETIVNKK